MIMTSAVPLNSSEHGLLLPVSLMTNICCEFRHFVNKDKYVSDKSMHMFYQRQHFKRKIDTMIKR